ncbi:MAG: hypothetical protein KDE15_14915 [Erythrobacter sp.]|nr:hypothetical protein [Erythrobacter sp.]
MRTVVEATSLSPRRQKAFYLFASLSSACSLAMVASVLLWPSVPLVAVIAINWALFITATFLAHNPGLTWKAQRLDRTNHNIWRVVILAFSACGIVAFVLAERLL